MHCYKKQTHESTKNKVGTVKIVKTATLKQSESKSYQFFNYHLIIFAIIISNQFLSIDNSKY